MKLDPISAQDLAGALGIALAADGNATATSIARLTRIAVQRWGVCASGDVTRYVKQQIEAIGGNAALDSIGEVRDRLLALGDLQRVRSQGRPLLARTPPRWVRLCESAAVFLGTQELPEGIAADLALADGQPRDEGVVPADPLAGLARRLRMTPDIERALTTFGAVALSVDEWWAATERDVELGPGPVVSLERRGEPAHAGIARLWMRLTALLEERGTSGAPAEDVWIVAGAPGGFYGKAPDVGRWRSATIDGIWCGRRRGPTEAAPKAPVVVRVNGGAPERLLDLHDEHEFLWALIGRGAALATEERVDFDEATGRVQFQFPPPHAIARLMHLLGTQVSAFGWLVSPGSRPEWRRFLRLGGSDAG